MSDQSGVLLRSFRLGDLNLELSTEADRLLGGDFLPTDSVLALSSTLFTGSSGIFGSCCLGGVWVLSADFFLSLRSLPRDLDLDLDESDDERDLRRDHDRRRDLRLRESDSDEDDGVLRERSVEASFRFVLEPWRRLRPWCRGERDLERERLLEINKRGWRIREVHMAIDKRAGECELGWSVCVFVYQER